MDYLARDSASPWASEARAHLTELSKPTPANIWPGVEQRLKGAIDVALADQAVREHMTEARNFTEHSLLAEWAAAVIGGGTGSAELDRVRMMGDSFLRVAGDALYRDAVRAIDQAEPGTGNAMTALARAHADYAEAAGLFGEDQFARAQAPFTTAQRLLASANSPFALRASIELGAIAYAVGKADEASRIFDSALAVAQSKGYAYAAARATWFQGLIAIGQGRLGDAQLSTDETLSAFERMGDQEQTGAAHNLVASLLLDLGDETQSWRHREAALSILPRTRSIRLRYGLLVGATAALRRQDAEAALAFQDAVVDTARSWGRDLAIVESLSQRSAILHEIGRGPEASAGLGLARRELGRIKEPALRQVADISVLTVESDLLRSTSPTRAAAAATEALAIVTARGIADALLHLNCVWRRRTLSGAVATRPSAPWPEEFKHSTRSVCRSWTKAGFRLSTSRGNCLKPRCNWRSRTKTTRARSQWPSAPVRARWQKAGISYQIARSRMSSRRYVRSKR